MIKWLKANPVFTLILVLGFGYFVLQFASSLFGINVAQISLPSAYRQTSSVSSPEYGMSATGSYSDSYKGAPSLVINPTQGATPGVERLVIQNSNLSLLVKDVREVGDKIVGYAKQAGGFMVSTSYNKPSESPFATITVRVPTTRFDEALAYYRSLAVKVTNENLIGEDVTETYIDIDERISTFEKTKAKFESILESAIDVTETLTVQREIINLQTQIDSLKGQKQSLEQNAALTKITVYLSTDELALPYTPEKTFRPGVIFKLAVRSLLTSLRSIAEAAIWIGVYSIIWIPALILYILYRRYRSRKAKI